MNIESWRKASGCEPRDARSRLDQHTRIVRPGHSSNALSFKVTVLQRQENKFVFQGRSELCERGSNPNERPLYRSSCHSLPRLPHALLCIYSKGEVTQN